VYRGSEQIGLARVISDYATFAYLADVYMLEAFRDQGLSKWLMECIVAHPELQGLRCFCLRTRDAHGLYNRYGFAPLTAPDRWLSKDDLTVYKRPAAGGKP
jgi:GNAT superfamily N-acetyltransferase